MTRWSSARRAKERHLSMDAAQSLLDNPVPWRIKEFDLLSQHLDCSRKSALFSQEYEGMLSTIYGEDFIGFHLKRFNESDFILSLAADNMNLSLVHSGNQGKIWMGDELLGRWSKNQVINQKNQLLGQVVMDSSYHRYIIDEKEVANASLRKENAAVNDRYFALVREDQIDAKTVWVFTIMVVMDFLKDDLI